ncbi:MAG: menaquinone-dependent protoporphyrinogen IX dehydrogenase [Actinomycetia bacterium]|nr:menaquinone-dependent protoporphyrinogen IX dehydrogenase [Actinomycetes bacterium]
MSKILVLHSSRFGQSIKIASAINDELIVRGLETQFGPLNVATAPNPAVHDALVLVASVRYGHFDKLAYDLVSRYGWWLERVPTLLVTVSLTARKEEKRDPAVHSYTRKFLDETGWVPTHTEVVAGALEYPRYNLLDKLAIQMIMTMTKGPTDPETMVEYTDWDRVEETADEFADIVTAARA